MKPCLVAMSERERADTAGNTKGDAAPARCRQSIEGAIERDDDWRPGMKYVCDAPNGRTWFRIETEAEAIRESEMMGHAVEKYFRNEREKAAHSFQPASKIEIEQNIGLAAHIQKAMPLFLTLRDSEGKGLVTAMLPPGGVDQPGFLFRPIIVGANNSDPYAEHGDAILALAQHYGLTLDREHCFPYRRG